MVVPLFALIEGTSLRGSRGTSGYVGQAKRGGRSRLRASMSTVCSGSKLKSANVPKIASTKSPARTARQIAMGAIPIDGHSGHGPITIAIPSGIASSRINKTSATIPTVFSTANNLARCASKGAL